jgi:hypothetical protein
MVPRARRPAAVNYFELPSPLGVRSWPALLAAWRKTGKSSSG